MDVCFAIDQGGEAFLGVEYREVDAKPGAVMFADQLHDAVAQAHGETGRFAAVVEVGKGRGRAAHAQIDDAAFQNVVQCICGCRASQANCQTCGQNGSDHDLPLVVGRAT